MSGMDRPKRESNEANGPGLPGYLKPAEFRLKRLLVRLFLVSAISLLVIYLTFRNQEIGNLSDAITVAHPPTVLLAFVVV